MKLLKKDVNSKRSGAVTLLPECDDDIFYVHNILAKDDLLTTKSSRKVSKDTSTEKADTFRINVVLTIVITSIELDVETPSIRVKGVNTTAHEYVNVGQFHTHEITVSRHFKLFKHQWDPVSQQFYQEACSEATTAKLAVVLLGEGTASIYLIGKCRTHMIGDVNAKIVRKRMATDERKKALNQFYSNVAKQLMSSIDFEVVEGVVLGSPGFYNEDLLKYITSVSSQEDFRLLGANRHKFVTTNTSSNYRYSLSEVLNDQKLTSKIESSKVFLESQALDQFFKVMNKEPCRVCYGLKHVQRAADQGAISHLFVLDELVRPSNIDCRAQYVCIIEAVRSSGGSVRIFSGHNDTGRELGRYTGIVAILRFAMWELDDASGGDDNASGA